ALATTGAGDVTHLPFSDGEFDIAVVDDTGAMLEQLGDTDRSTVAREVARVLRPGGRLLLIGGAVPTGFAKLISKVPASPLVLSGRVNALLQQCGFGIVGTLAER